MAPPRAFLLERLAQALGLVYRFYNASLLNYDDLVGIPLPDETQTSLRYITTPTAIWDAEVVFVDELNRTRPDLQNKLFPIIHERRVQWVELEKLRYRSAAMNREARQRIPKGLRARPAQMRHPCRTRSGCLPSTGDEHSARRGNGAAQRPRPAHPRVARVPRAGSALLPKRIVGATTQASDGCRSCIFTWMSADP